MRLFLTRSYMNNLQMMVVSRCSPNSTFFCGSLRRESSYPEKWLIIRVWVGQLRMLSAMFSNFWTLNCNYHGLKLYYISIDWSCRKLVFYPFKPKFLIRSLKTWSFKTNLRNFIFLHCDYTDIICMVITHGRTVLRHGLFVMFVIEIFKCITKLYKITVTLNSKSI